MLPGFVNGAMLVSSMSSEGGAVSPVASTLASTYVTTTNPPTSFSTTQAIGTYSAGRITVLTIAFRQNTAGTLNSVSVGGIAATRVARSTSTAAAYAEVWVVASGAGTSLENLTSATIAFTTSLSSSHLSMVVYAMTGSTTTPSATDGSSATSESVSAAAKSVTFGVAVRSDASAIGMSGLTVDYTASQGTFFGGQHGSKASTGAETVSVTANSGSTAMVLATFAPA